MQEVFRWSAHPFEPDTESIIEPTHGMLAVNSQTPVSGTSGSWSVVEVSAVMEAKKSNVVTPHFDLLLPQLINHIVPTDQPKLKGLSHKKLAEKQQSDGILARVISYVERGKKQSSRECKREPVEVVRLLRSWNKFVMRAGILYRVSKDVVSKKKTFQYVVPKLLLGTVLRGVHDDAGHQGQQRTLYLVRQSFFGINLRRM